MSNRINFCILYVICLGIVIHRHAHDGAPINLLVLPLVAALTTYFIPVAWPLGWFDRHVLGYEPFSAGHYWSCVWTMLLVATAVWFFPLDRVERWFGSYNACGGWRPRVPSVSRVAATVLDKVRRLFGGKGKTGGWA